MRDNNKRIVFGKDEVYNGKLYKKAKDESFFENRFNLSVVETIWINDCLPSSLLEKINQFLLEKPSLTVQVFLKDAHGFNFGEINNVVTLGIDFDTLTTNADLAALSSLKTLGVGVLDGKCKNFLDSIGTLTQLPDLRIGYINSSLNFLSNLSQLKRLDLKGVKSKGGLSFLSRMPNLLYFIIYQGHFSSYKGINNCSNLLRLDLGYLRNFSNEIIDQTFENLQQLKALELSCLPKLTNINFLSGLKSLEYLEMNSLKQLESLSPIANLNLNYLKADSFVPLDKRCDYLDKVKFVLLDAGYDKTSKAHLIDNFKGDSLFMRKSFKDSKIDLGDLIYSYKPEHLLKDYNTPTH
jgi:hypothetical protein